MIRMLQSFPRHHGRLNRRARKKTYKQAGSDHGKCQLHRCTLAVANLQYRRATDSDMKARCALWTCDACSRYDSVRLLESARAVRQYFSFDYRAITLNLPPIAPSKFDAAYIDSCYAKLRQIVREMSARCAGACGKIELAFTRRDSVTNEPSAYFHLHFEAACPDEASAKALERIARRYSSDVHITQADGGWLKYLLKPVVRRGRVAPEHLTIVERVLDRWCQENNYPPCVLKGGIYSGYVLRWARYIMPELQRRKRALLETGQLRRACGVVGVDRMNRRSKSYKRWMRFAHLVVT